VKLPKDPRVLVFTDDPEACKTKLEELTEIFQMERLGRFFASPQVAYVSPALGIEGAPSLKEAKNCQPLTDALLAAAAPALVAVVGAKCVKKFALQTAAVATSAYGRVVRVRYIPVFVFSDFVNIDTETQNDREFWYDSLAPEFATFAKVVRRLKE
jgi:uracil-DNA glycosylase